MVRGRRIARQMRGLVLVALLLVPLVSSGHHHAASASSAPCAVCIAAHHAPAVVTPSPAVIALMLSLAKTPLLTLETPAHRVHASNAGRAPPSSSSTLLVS